MRNNVSDNVLFIGNGIVPAQFVSKDDLKQSVGLLEIDIYKFMLTAMAAQTGLIVALVELLKSL